jgi:hypothetical protein
MGNLPETDIPVTKEDITSLLNILEGETIRSQAQVVLSQPSPSETGHLINVLFPVT